MIIPHRGCGHSEGHVHWELLGVELKRENKPHGDGASLTEAAVGGLEPVASEAREDGNKDSCCWNPRPILPFETYRTIPCWVGGWQLLSSELMPSGSHFHPNWTSFQPFLPSRVFCTSLQIAAKAISPKRKRDGERWEKLEVCQVGGETIKEWGRRYSSQYKVSVCQMRVQERTSGR